MAVIFVFGVFFLCFCLFLAWRRFLNRKNRDVSVGRPCNIAGHGKEGTTSPKAAVQVQYSGVPFMKVDIDKSVEENLKYNECLLDEIKEHAVETTESPVRGLLCGCLGMYVDSESDESEEENWQNDEVVMDHDEEHFPLGFDETESPIRGLLCGVLGMYVDSDESDDESLENNEVDKIEEHFPTGTHQTEVIDQLSEAISDSAGHNMEEKPKKKKKKNRKKRFLRFLKRCMCIRED